LICEHECGSESPTGIADIDIDRVTDIDNDIVGLIADGDDIDDLPELIPCDFSEIRRYGNAPRRATPRRSNTDNSTEEATPQEAIPRNNSHGGGRDYSIF
jgi:hypothetical protein